MTQDPILIAGGGIGGVAAAAALARRGIRSIVVEAAPALGEIGAGIQIGPNAFHCFDALGVGEAMRETAVYVDALRLMDATSGEAICDVDLGKQFRAHMGNPYAVVHRADLHRRLLEACEASPLVEIRTGHRVTGYDQEGISVTLHVEGRSSLTGRALIAADGLRSPIRAQMIGDGPPRVSGHTTYRSVIPTERMPEDLRWNAATLWAGPKCHIVHYPLKGGAVFNLVVTYHRDVTEAKAGVPVTHEEVAQGFEHVHSRARRIIEHGDDWKLWVLCDREPISDWQDGRVVLLGDAAHPMLQYMAQGACMAMEDAVVLAAKLDDAADVEAALRAYQDARRVRTARVQMGSRLVGEYVYHPDDAKAAVRDQAMRSKSTVDWCRELEWLYGRDALDAYDLPLAAE